VAWLFAPPMPPLATIGSSPHLFNSELTLPSPSGLLALNQAPGETTNLKSSSPPPTTTPQASPPSADLTQFKPPLLGLNSPITSQLMITKPSISPSNIPLPTNLCSGSMTSSSIPTLPVAPHLLLPPNLNHKQSAKAPM